MKKTKRTFNLGRSIRWYLAQLRPATFLLRFARRWLYGAGYAVVTAPLLRRKNRPAYQRPPIDQDDFWASYVANYAGGDFVRYHTLFVQARRVLRANIPGDLAELGVYQGQTAKILLRAAPERRLHLFDTFSGQPENASVNLDGAAYTQMLSQNRLRDTSVEGVTAYLGHPTNVICHVGYFPQTASGLEHQTFALVHLDGDQYQSTWDGCAFFYPRLSPGGALICHDYGIYQGVMQAIDQYFDGRPEVVIEMADGSGSVLIVKPR